MARQGIGTGSSPNDGAGDNLRTAGGKINDNFSELYGYFGDGTTLSRGTWNIVSSGINTLSSVGIGTTNPRFTLEVGAVGASGTSLYVNGDARVTGILTVGSSSVTLNGSTNEITVGTGITINGNTGIISATQVTIAGETLTGAGVTSLVAGSNITLSGSTGQVTISSSGGGAGAGGTWANYDSNAGISTTKKVKIESDLEVTGVTTSTSGLRIVGGGLTVTGVSTFFGDIKIGDGSGGTPRINIGDGAGVHPQDAEIYHSSTYGTVFQDDTSTGIQIWTGGVGGIKGQNGTNFIVKTNGGGDTAELYSGGNKKLETTTSGVTVTGTVSDSKGELRKLIPNTQSGAYTLVSSDAGKYIWASGAVTVPNNIFSAGDMVTIVNDTNGNLTITNSLAVMYMSSDGTSAASRTLGAYGMATLLFVSGTAAYISGAGLS